MVVFIRLIITCISSMIPSDYKFKVINSMGVEHGLFKTHTMAKLFVWALKFSFARAPFVESFSIVEIVE